MPGDSSTVIEVALPVPLRHNFDYAPPTADAELLPGMRVRVPFGRQHGRIGIVVAVHRGRRQARPGGLKRISAVIDTVPLFAPGHLALLQWAADYYQHPAGEVLFAAIPTRLRQGASATRPQRQVWQLSARTPDAMPGTDRAPRQRAALEALRRAPGGLDDADLAAFGIQRAALQALARKGMVECRPETGAPQPDPVPSRLQLNAAQHAAVDAVSTAAGGYQPFLLNGVTGSGKTEVYLELIARTVAAGRQALVLVPEIGLTPQFIERVGRRIPGGVVVLHSALSESERLLAWLDARDARAAVVLGTRSAVWTPLARPGLVIVDEEHDGSYKQQDGLRYSARDVAIVRARDAGVPILLGSATPAMETLHNVGTGRYAELRLPRRAGSAVAPEVHVVDLRGQPLHGALSEPLLRAIAAELQARRQVLLFLNRRGYAPVVLCHGCGWIAACSRCGVPLTYHKQKRQLLCHHCGACTPPAPSCPECGAEQPLQVGHGTERLAETLAERFPGAGIMRVDRDSTRRRGSMERMVRDIHAGAADILIGTQMLAKGHDFPNLTLVGIIDADRGLFSADFRAGERMAQLIVQVSGRAGRAALPGRVLIQTHHPEHPLLRALINEGYEGFARNLLEERRAAELPPFSCLALLRAEHFTPEAPMRFLEEAGALLSDGAVQVFGPVPAPMERRAGRWRFQLLLQSASRARLGRALRPWAERLEGLASGRRVRWSLDVDPQDML